MTTQPEPLNLKLARFTPAWARPQRARRALAALMYALPLLAGVLSNLTDSALSRIAALIGAVAAVVIFAWLVGATGARADMPDAYLDERERAQRSEVYRLAFINLMGIVALGFLASRFLPGFERLPASGLVGLLFFVGMLMPTAVQAWIEPDPVQD